LNGSDSWIVLLECWPWPYLDIVPMPDVSGQLKGSIYLVLQNEGCFFLNLNALGRKSWKMSQTDQPTAGPSCKSLLWSHIGLPS
jgi:hypothetical protein